VVRVEGWFWMPKERPSTALRDTRPAVAKPGCEVSQSDAAERLPFTAGRGARAASGWRAPSGLPSDDGSDVYSTQAERPAPGAALPGGAGPPVKNQSGGADYDALFREIYPSLFQYVQRLTGEADVAEDIAQESFVRLLGRNMDEHEARLWLFTVATNLFRDRTRTSRRRERLLSANPWKPAALPRPDESLERERKVAGVRQALEKLPLRDRQMLLMREEGFRYDEIARVAEVAPGSVGTLLARATRRFVAVYDASMEDG
jgi:RNA polymerase sigma-70 factor, ECF subfamily